jgi:hypothetical protein
MALVYCMLILKATDTHSEYIILLVYDNGCTNRPQSYVILTSPVLSCEVSLKSASPFTVT